MKEKPLYEQILEYLYHKNAFTVQIGILNPFNSYITSETRRRKFKQAVSFLKKEGLIEPNVNHLYGYRRLTDKQANQLIPLDRFDVKARLTLKGKDYVDSISSNKTQIANIAIHGDNKGNIGLIQSSSNTDANINIAQTNNPPIQKKNILLSMIKWIGIVLGAIAAAIAVIQYLG